MRDLPIRTLMSANVDSITPDTSLAEAVQTMRQQRYSCLIVTQDNEPVGVITERDIVSIVAESCTDTVLDLNNVPVSDYMTTPPVCINVNATLFEALVLTKTRKIRHLPVINKQQKLVGLITYSDLVQSHFNLVEQQAEIIEQTVARRTKALQKTNEQLTTLSLEDVLLGIGNRRAMEVDLDHCHATAMRYGNSYSLALLDVDFFKKYNDHYGHMQGDAALQEIASHVQQAIRKSDRLYRYGGEEMLLLMPETPLNGAQILTERLVQSLFECGISHEHSPYKAVTMSVGIAHTSGCQKNMHKHWQDVIKHADIALYEAKNQGRNRAISFQHIQKTPETVE